MSYLKLSSTSAKFISKQARLDEEQEQVIAYAIEGLLLSVTGFASIVFVGALFGAALPALIAGLSGGVLRKFSGGAHASSPLRCIIFGALGYGSLAVIAKYLSKVMVVNNGYLLLALIICLLIVVIYAPVDCAAKRIKSPVLRKRLKLGAVCFVLLMMCLVVTVDAVLIKVSITLGILYQTATLFPFLNKT
ncbi:accessory gene regulator ArgB-like protein [Candidatus Formimonas warabiya]|uniref:Accessory regulator AgrB n=1 Tax=Formimonas warabiya TaxID=1761012 RepID=A0A3G1KQ43_FORW1|nr:accessory gene regulator B family protein [Candidatus Formimonas warabiya]ATW24584.1 hypothetical protein DCMF_07110 [Candidatus Formimonas warabiya]